MRTNAMHNGGVLAGPQPRRRRPDHPEDYGRGPWWRLAELLFLGFTFPSPPPVTRLWPEDDEERTA
jgi:hypothetical protein